MACNSTTQPPRNTNVAPLEIQNLIGDWVRSFEEEQPGSEIEVFRPSESREFEPSWFRMRYVIHEDGNCEWLVLHARDAHFMATGRWEVDTLGETVVRIFDSEGALVTQASFRVIELTPEVLRIKKMPKLAAAADGRASGDE